MTHALFIVDQGDILEGEERMGETVIEFEAENIEDLCLSMNHADVFEPKLSKSGGEFMEFLVGRFKDVKIEIFANEHPPLHFRVKTNAETGNFTIDECAPLNGSPPIMRRHREIKRWHTQNRTALINK